MAGRENALRAGDGQPLFTLRQVAENAGGRILAGRPEATVTGVAVDTRAVQSGDLFCALRGERVDAHDLIPQAVHAGASGILVDRDPPDHYRLTDVPAGVGVVRVGSVPVALGRLARWHLEQNHPALRVCAVTGSVGKTSACRFLAAALGAGGGEVLTPEGSFNTDISLPLVCLRARSYHRYAALELGMRGPGQIRYLAEICRPTVALLTLIGRSHLEQLGSIEAIVRAKGELVTAIPAGGIVVLNRDDPRQHALAETAQGRVLWYGVTESAVDVRAVDLAAEEDGAWRFLVKVAGSNVLTMVRLRLVGRHQVANALGALACAFAEGVELTEAAERLGGVAPAPGRLQVRDCGTVQILDDTYNASPDSVAAALAVLRGRCPRAEDRALILGDMRELGPQSKYLHRLVGEEVAAMGVRWLVTVGFDAQATAEGAVAAGMPADRVRVVADSAEVSAVIGTLLTSGLTVLVKGSRAVGLETVVDEIAEWAARRDA